MDDEWKRACQAVLEYDSFCDPYDVLICGPDGMPKTGQQSGLVNRHALEVRKQMLQKYRVSADVFQKALAQMRRK